MTGADAGPSPPGPPVEPRPVDPAALALRRVEALIELRRWEDARRGLAPVLASDSGNARTWCLMAQVQLGLGHPDEALRAAATAVPLAPDDEWPHRLASIALEQQGRHDEAVGAARESVRLEPGSWVGFTRLAHALLRTEAGREESVWAGQRAVELGPMWADAHVAYGAALAKTHQRVPAAAAFRAALAIDPQNSAAHNELARLHLRKRSLINPSSLADAAGGFADAVQADPRAAVSRRNLDLTARLFVGRVCYLIMIAAYVVATTDSNDAGGLARFVPLVVLAAPAIFAGRFLTVLPGSVRRYLWSDLRRSSVRGPVVLAVLAVVALLVTCVTPANSRAGLALCAALAAVLALLTQRAQLRSLRRSRA